MPNPRLTSELIAAAIDGYEAQKTRIDARIAELRQMLDGRRNETTAAATPGPTKRKRRKMSAAGRKAIAEAQRKRWAVAKKATAPQEAVKPKRRISKAGMARIIAATKKRWRLAKAAKAQQDKAAKSA